MRIWGRNSDVPANPIFGPHFRTARTIGFQVVAVPTIASIDLRMKIEKILSIWLHMYIKYFTLKHKMYKKIPLA